MDIAEWLQMGVVNGYCTEAVCETHDGVKMTEEEEQEFEDGGDPCIPVVRLWADQ